MGRNKLTEEQKELSKQKRKEYLEKWKEEHSKDYYRNNREKVLAQQRQMRERKKGEPLRTYNKIDLKNMTEEERKNYFRNKNKLSRAKNKVVKKVAMEEDIREIIDFLDITEVVLPKYSTAKPKYCISEEFKISVKNILNRLEQLEKENKECKLDVQDYLKQAQENAEIYRKAQKKIQDLKINSIPKSEIRDKIEELNNYDSEFSQRVSNHSETTLTEFVQNILKEILGED